MERFLFLLLIVFAAFLLITFVLHKIFRNRFFKYIPGILSFIGGIYLIYLSQTANQGLADIGYAIMSMMFFTGFLATLIMGFYLDIIKPRLGK